MVFDTHRQAAACCAAAVFAWGAAMPGDALAEVDFSGETVEIVFNTGPGGAVGLTAQLVAQNIGQYLPGNPEVIAVPMPGGALLKGIQFVKNADPDGLTLGWLAWSGSTRVLDPEPLRVNYDDFGAIGGLATEWVSHIRTDAGGGSVTTPEEFMALDSITHGGISPTASTDIRTLASMDLLGIDMKYVGGHKGGSGVLAALRRGEVEMRSATISNYLTTVEPEMVETGESIPLFYWGQPAETGEVIDDQLSPIPTFYDFFIDMKGEAPSGPAYEMLRYLNRTSDGLAWLFTTPPGTPEEIVAVYDDAFTKLVEDPAFIEAATKVLSSTPVPVMREETEAIIEEVTTVSPEILDEMRAYIQRLSR